MAYPNSYTALDVGTGIALFQVSDINGSKGNQIPSCLTAVAVNKVTVLQMFLLSFPTHTLT